jgi:hypothetical protein
MHGLNTKIVEIIKFYPHTDSYRDPMGGAFKPSEFR